MSGKLDPFSRPTPLPQGLLQKYKLGRDVPASELEGRRVKSRLQQGAKLSKHAQRLVARSDLLLPEEAGFLEADEGEDTCTILQQHIASVVDITSSAKGPERQTLTGWSVTRTAVRSSGRNGR
ncbi:WD repeat-containing protein 46-like isoform X2 [Rhinoraja longicauda]